MMQRTAIVFAILLLAACGSGEPPADNDYAAVTSTVEPPSAQSEPAAGIDWFDGSVDEAFAAAAEAGKPVYLYWGAEWCPPCHAIKATVFRSPEFIERSKLFVPVYLDGDDENAQAAGERFGVLGYPTMIVFDSAGNELTRIPGGIDLAAYANVLDLTLSNSSSTRALVARALDTDAPLAERECAQLAFYSWGQDPAMFESRDRAATLRTLWGLCPAGLVRERALLYMSWLEARIAAAESGERVRAFTAEESAGVLAFLERLLGDDALVRDNALAINMIAPDIVAAVTGPGSEARAEMTARLIDAYDRLFADEALYKRERLYALMGKIGFERIDDPDAEISDGLKEEIRAAAAWADASTPAPYERQPIINAMANILGEAGMNDLRRELLLAELDISSQPYYFMPDLADIEQSAGNSEKALAWLKRGWDESKGPATRFQWGYYYLQGLLEMTPADIATIRATTIAMIDELQNGGGLYQRPKAQLERLEGALTEWGEAHDSAAALAEIRSAVARLCPDDAEPDSRRLCEEFLETA